jgi:hypothetical protein
MIARRTNFLRRFKCAIAMALCLFDVTPNLMAQEYKNQVQPGETAGDKATDARAAQLRQGMEGIFKKYPEKFTAEIIKGFSDHEVVIGMDPYLAHLTAGAFAYKVQADRSKWPGDADPMLVMWTQARRPDDSKIWMTFENDTQFPNQGVTKFTVYFENGRATQIKKISALP